MKMTTRNMIATVALAALATAAHAVPVDVDALANSSSGGTGANTGIVLAMGLLFNVSVDVNDLWSAGALPRWSNADGLTGNRFATGTDESGEAAGTLIGIDFGLWTQNGLSLPFGTLVGELSGVFFEIGTAFSGAAPAAGTLLLYYWDSNNFDNTGSVLADVTVGTQVPVPFTPALLGLGLAGLAALRRKRP